MSKNLTRKGLAFGALVALGASVIAGAPASAAGIDNNSVSLIPTTGSEYSILAGSSLDLKANRTALLNTPNLKFLVTDAAQKIRFDADVDSGVNEEGAHVKAAITSISVTTNVATATSAAHGLMGSGTAKIVLSGLTGSPALLALNGTVVTATYGAAGTFTFPVTTADAVAAQTTAFAALVTVDGLDNADAIRTAPLGDASVVSAGVTINKGDSAATATRATDGSFVIATNVTTNGADTHVRFASTDTASTVTGTVTAWVDDNGNNAIDSTEYQSPARTISFLAAADVVSSVVARPVSVGDTTITADVTTVPVLNGNQIIAAQNLGSDAAALQVAFTRPGSVETILSGATNAGGSTTWSNTTKKWSVVSPDMANVNATTADASTGGWGVSQPTAVTSHPTNNTVAVKGNVVTIKTAITHNLQVGDRVVVSGSTANTRVNSAIGTATYSTISSVPTTTSFTYKEAGTSATELVELADAAVVVAVAGGNTKSLRNFVVAGAYTAKAHVYKYETTNALTATGTATAITVGASSADTLTLAGVSSANVSAAGAVRVGTTTVNAFAEVLDEDGAAVAAGIDATITVGNTLTGAGAFTVNGTSVTAGTVVTAKTNAAGKVDVVITNSSAAADNAITLIVKVQGSDSNSVTFTWSKAVYSIVDLADANAVVTVTNTPATVRSAAVGGTHTFNLLAQDQWKTALADATVRIHAASTTRTVFDTFITPVAGKFSVAVADGAASATATATVSITFQKLIDGIWSETEGGTAANDAAFVDSSAAAGEGDAFTVNFVTQTDKITMNANGANFPAATTVAASADLAATVVAKALKAIDLRVTDGTATTYAAANKAVVAGVVANATTGALRAGASVTAAGAGLLFNVGDVWALDSITWISNTGDFAVNVYSASSGDKKVTITSGAATSSSTVAFTGTATDKKVLTLTAPVSVLAGATLSANILLVDGNGNAVDTVAPAATPVAAYIKVSYDGPGLLSGSLPTETDSDGKANVRYLTGVSDAGIATITVKYDQNFDGDFIDATDIVVTKTVLIGSSAVVSANASVAGIKGYVATTVRNASGKAVTVTVNGRVLTPRAPNVAAQLFKFRAKAGKTTVVVKVDGVTVSSRTVTVK